MMRLTFSGANLSSSFVEDDPLVSDVSLLFVVLPGLKTVVFYLVGTIKPKNFYFGITTVLECYLGASHFIF